MTCKEQTVSVANISNVKKQTNKQKQSVHNVAQKILIGHHWHTNSLSK